MTGSEMTDFEILKLLGSWGGIAIVTTAIVQALKKAFTFADGNEPKIALLVGPLLAVAAKFAGVIAQTPGAAGWVVAVVGGILAGGVGGQIVHDKFWNPVAKLLPKGGKDGKKEEDVP